MNKEDKKDIAAIEDSVSRASNRKLLKWIGIGAAVISFVLAATLAVFVIFDPFGLIALYFGRADPIASVVPEDTAIYLSVDMIRLTSSDDLDKIIQTFIEAGDGDVDEIDSMLSSLDSLFENEYDFAFTEDIQPWIGRYAGLSMANINMDIFSSTEAPSMVFVVEVSDKNGADEFVEELMGIIESNTFGEGEFEEAEYEEITIYELEDDYSPVAIARSGNFLMIGNGADSIERVIDAQNGESLADSALYQEAVGQLPKDRMITGYINSQEILNNLSSLGTTGLPPKSDFDYNHGWGCVFSGGNRGRHPAGIGCVAGFGRIE